MNHIMLDLETMGNTSNSAIIAIGAVKFNPTTGELGDEFYTEVSLESCYEYGLTADASTILWWLQQDDAARAKFKNNAKAPKIADALKQFTMFIGDIRNAQTWGNGISFDLGLLGDTYQRMGLPKPWMFWNERDVRTVSMIDDDQSKKNIKFDGIPHYALDDAKHQVKYVSNVLQTMELLR